MRPPHAFKLPSDTGAASLGEALARAHADSVAHRHMEEQGTTDGDLFGFAGVRSWRQFHREYRSLLLAYDDALTVFESLADADGYAPWPTKETSPTSLCLLTLRLPRWAPRS